MAVKFENIDRRIDKINKVLAEYGISSLEEARDICLNKGFDPMAIVKGIQPIAFDVTHFNFPAQTFILRFYSANIEQFVLFPYRQPQFSRITQ